MKPKITLLIDQSKNKKTIIQNYLFFIIGLIVLLGISTYVFLKVTADSEKNTKERMLEYTRIFNSAINPERVKNLTNTSDDIENPDYQRLREQLFKIEEAGGQVGFRWIYTISQRGNEVIFGVDSIPVDTFGHSEPGEIYTSIDPIEKELIFDKVFSKGEELITGPYTDVWGTWLTFYVPIKSFKDKNVLGALATDLDYYSYKSKITNNQLMVIVISIFVLLSYVLVFLYILSIQKNLRKSKEERDKFLIYEEILKNISDGIYIVNLKDGTIVYTNPKFEDIFGYQQGEMLGKNASIINVPTEKDQKDKANEIIDTLNKTGIWVGEIENIKKDGTHFWCRASCSILEYSPQDRFVIAVYSDISIAKEKDKQQKIDREQLEKINNIMIGRELKMLEMKKKILELGGEVKDEI